MDVKQLDEIGMMQDQRLDDVIAGHRRQPRWGEYHHWEQDPWKQDHEDGDHRMNFKKYISLTWSI